MLIPILHFENECAKAISLYEKAFNTKANNYDYGDKNKIRHAEMDIFGQKIFLNDSKDYIKNIFGINFAAHLIITFETSESLLACYDILKDNNNLPTPFIETQYSKLVGNFMDKFGVLWGFMVV
jgi:uncharacterized glyoxalase superfamily protein PhnB